MSCEYAVACPVTLRLLGGPIPSRSTPFSLWCWCIGRCSPPPATPKVVIVGASGYTGAATVDAVGALVGAANVKVITRHPESSAATGFKSSGIHVVKGDYNDQASLVAAFAGAAAVYLIAPGSEVRGRLNPLLSVPVSGNRRIPRLVRRLRCVRFPFLA